MSVAAWQGGPGGPWPPQRLKFSLKGGAQIPKKKKYDAAFELFTLPMFSFCSTDSQLSFVAQDYSSRPLMHDFLSSGRAPLFQKHSPTLHPLFADARPVRFLRAPLQVCSCNSPTLEIFQGAPLSSCLETLGRPSRSFPERDPSCEKLQCALSDSLQALHSKSLSWAEFFSKNRLLIL